MLERFWLIQPHSFDLKWFDVLQQSPVIYIGRLICLKASLSFIVLSGLAHGTRVTDERSGGYIFSSCNFGAVFRAV